MGSLVLSALDRDTRAIEVVERKGLGHPDTICDALAENFSRNLCREYRKRFGTILHHNVDKALLCGGKAAPAFSAGSVIAPMEIILAGRAVIEAGGEQVPIEEIAVEGSRDWLCQNFHALDVQRDVRIAHRVAPGSQNLQDLFAGSERKAARLANDTSIGVGYTPLSPLERLVLDVEKRINGRDRVRLHPAWGEDVKVMAVRRDKHVRLTIACAMIGRHLRQMDDYLAEKEALRSVVSGAASEFGFSGCDVHVNAGDQPQADQVYLTVTGTSAEAGDDGEVGRGNRVNGLITPCRPMSLEAAAGKNPVTHVGKLYNVLAQRIAEALVAELPDVIASECLLVSQIGGPIAQPASAEVRCETRDGRPVETLRSDVDEIVAQTLGKTPSLIDDFVAGRISIF